MRTSIVVSAVAVAALGIFGMSAPAAHAVPAHPAVTHPDTPAQTLPPMNTVTKSDRIKNVTAGTKTPQPGNATWTGYAVTADSGKTINQIVGELTVPTANCSDTYMGTTGEAYTDYWVGIDGFGENEVEQDGISADCSGSVGHTGTGTPSYYAWYDICCTGPGLQNMDLPSGVVSPGKVLKFGVTWIPADNEYQFVVYYGTGFSSHSTFYQTCPTGSTCQNGTAEVITEDPGGGPPEWPMVQWNGSSAPAYSNIQVTAADGTVGTLNTQAGEWTSSGALFMNESKPIILTGDSTAGYGLPGSLDVGGDSFGTDCSYYTSTTTASCPAAPSSGVDWNGLIENAGGSYAKTAPHTDQVTWVSGRSSASNFIAVPYGTSGSDQVIQIEDNNGLCWDQSGGSNFMESCPTGDTNEGFIVIPEAGGYYELENQADRECATAVQLSDAIVESTCSPNSGNEWTIPGSYSGE